jgi:predicted NAD/FAD-dependent oxidoreductase
MTHPIAMIGAGLAGLAAAGRQVRLYDKGRGAGGRLATRRAEVAGARLQFDHGAQYLTARGAPFRQALEAAGARPWPAAGEGRLVGLPGMSAIPRALQGDLPLFGARHVTEIAGGPGAWTLRHLDAALVRPGRPLPDAPPAEDGPFAAILLAVPAPQAVPLLAPLDPAAASRLGAVELAPCWTVLASFEARLDQPDILRPAEGPLAWAARDGSKPGRDATAECWVLQASPAWSRAHLEQPPEQVLPPLLAALGGPAPRFAAAHRWRYALAERPLGESHLWNAALGIGVCGDWCLAGRAEAAWDSGTALAAALLG